MSPKIQLLPEEPVSETEDALYYHGFKLDNIVFSCLHYIQFRKHGQIWWGKIHSIWMTKNDRKEMIEVQPFRNVPDNQRRTDYEEYDELYSVIGKTIDIAASSVLPYECRLVWVPPHITDDDIIAYVEENIGKAEYDDDTRAVTDSDDNDDFDDMGDFIVQGDRWGFYQYAINEDSTLTAGCIDYSPSPQFVDLAMSITKERLEQDDWYKSELSVYIFNNYIKTKYPAMNTYKDCIAVDAIDTFSEKMKEELLLDDRNITKMYAMCLGMVYG